MYPQTNDLDELARSLVLETAKQIPGDASPDSAVVEDGLRGRTADPIVRLEAFLSSFDVSSRPVVWVVKESIKLDGLRTHLRTINRVRLASEEQTVQFRHADGAVLGQVATLLGAEQRRRLLGPAKVVLFVNGGVREIGQVPEERAPPPGPLAFSLDQVRTLDAVRINALANDVADYLERVAVDRTAHVPRDVLTRRVEGWVEGAATLGVRSEVAFKKWAYMQLITDGRLLEAPRVAEFVARPGFKGTPDERVSQLMNGGIRDLRNV